jgi:tetratricopeptide (TPR) repeat protein
MSTRPPPEGSTAKDDPSAEDGVDDAGIRTPMRRLAKHDDAEAARMLDRLAARMFDEVPSIERVGRFELRERLGAGAMGVVYAAWDPELDRRVAIKLLRDTSGTDAELRLVREAKAMAQLRHPNVIQVYEVGHHDGQIFVAMQVIEGISLRTWLTEQRRTWQEIVAVFIEAGRGLAAAHAAGLVHRDFKPDNVLLEAGRVFVGDFGLARRQAAGVELASETGVQTPHADADTTLTQTGAAVGTPAYMAPEAFGGAPPDVRADQYGFCASLFEALHRQRPFPQQTLSSLAAAKRDELVVPAAAQPGERIPRWLDRIARRGLAAQPEQRFASMDALIEALERGLERRRFIQRGLALAGASLLAVGIGAAVVSANDRTLVLDAAAEPACAGAEARLDGVWDRDRAQRVRAAFTASELAYADGLLDAVDANLEAYASDWIAEHLGACEATHVRHEQSARALDLRMRCLDRRRSELDALLDRFEHPTRDDITNSLHAIHALAPVSGCAEIERLESTTPLPEDPATRQAVEGIRADLDRVTAAMSTNQHAQVEALAQQLVDRATAANYRPVAAEARLAYGVVLSRIGKPQPAEEVLEQAIVDAQASGHDEVAARALAATVYVAGHLLRDAERGRLHLRQAEALLEHIGQPKRSMAMLARNAGTVEFSAGNYEAARVQFERAIELFTALDGPAHFSVAETRSNLAAVERRLGRVERALELYAEASRDLEAALGPMHPGLLNVLNNMAASYIVLGRHAEAEAKLEQALALAERSFAHDHATVGHPLNNLGEVLLAQGRYPEARERYTQAIETWERSLGPRDSLLGYPLTGRGAVAIELREFDDARADLERALEIRRATEARPQQLGETEFLLALALDGLDEGPTAQRRSRSLAEQALLHLGEADGDLVRRARVVDWLAGRR